MRIHFAIDFDGTVTLQGKTERFDQLADPARLIVEHLAHQAALWQIAGAAA